MFKRYFGTDGIRGRAGEPPITADFMVKLGGAAGIGVQFNDSADGEAARTKIESILAGILASERPTYTM